METQKIDLHSDTESEIDRGEVRGNIVWKGNQYPIFEGENIIGREDDCDVTIEHDSVSLKHAVLDFEDGVARMRDLKSKNGTSLESSAGSGNYVKLGPTRRNEEVKTGCKIRFGLVDCKYFEVESLVQEPESTKKAPLKYDCETQFINLAAPESDDEEEDGEDHAQALLNKSTSNNSAYDHSYDRPPVGRNPFSASGSVGSTRSVALEMETQLDQDLNSAEKALVHSANTPSSIFSSRLVQGIASGVTASPAANSVMSTPIAINLPTAPSTGHSTRNSSTSTTPAAPVALSLAAFAERNISPATATGDDECSTEDDGLEDESDDHVPIEIPIPAFHPVGIAQEPLSDDSDEESEMSQDLMQVEDNAEEEGENAGEPAATLSRPATPLALPSPSAIAPRAASAAASAVDIKPQEDIATDDEGVDNASVDFKLAQDDRHPDELTARHNAQKEPLSRQASLTASTYAVASSDSPFHNLASTDSRLDAPMLDDGLENAHHEDPLPAVGHASHILPDANTEPQEFFTAQDPPPSAIVPDTFTPNASSASPTISGSERERAGDLRTAIRSPGAAIRDLLSTSGLPAGVKVFESQGGLVEDVKHSASPAMSSMVSESLPPDAPSMRFDFVAVNKGGASSSSVAPMAAPLAAVVEKDAAGLDPEVEKLLQKSAAAKPKPFRGKKRILDDDSEEEFDEPLRGPSRTTSATTAASSLEPKSAAKRSRTNPRIDTDEPAEIEPPTSAAKKGDATSSSAPSTAKKATSRGKKAPSPLPIIEEAEEQDAGESEPGQQTHTEEDAPVSTKKQPAAKKGRPKASTSFATEEPDEAVPPVETVHAATEKTLSKRGRGKTIVAESAAQEEEQPASDDTVAQMAVAEEEVVPELPKAVSKRGRGRAVETEPVAVEPAPVPVAVRETVEEEKSEPIVTKTPAKRGKGKTTSFAEEVAAPTEEPVPVDSAASEAAQSVAAQPAVKKGRGKTAQMEEPTHTEAHPYVPEAPTALKARGKSSASKQTAYETEADEGASLSSKTAKKGLKRSATTSAEDSAEAAATSVESSADEEVRILFTKVDDTPYLKFIKSLPRASVTSDATIATHCVTLAELKRTPKLMVALNCGVKYVVTEQWMKDCVKAKALVDVVTEIGAAPAKKSKKADTAVVEDPRADAGLFQQLLASPYIVKDAEKEKLWGFSMATTLSIPRNVPTATQLFGKMCIFCTKGVCGETAPPADELRAIIESGGGHWLASLDEWSQYTAASSSASGTAKSAKVKSAAGNSATDGELHTLVVISHPTVLKKEVTKKVNEAIGKGNPATSGVYSIELVFLACLKQRVEFEPHLLK